MRSLLRAAGAEAPEFTTLLAAVQAADPAILATLTGAGPYTAFAPTDAAFTAALKPWASPPSSSRPTSRP
ncbi:MAG: fasciclin domain-containing protein [Chloroflexi bacterium]|nr:fasciclin domain-containing protein [Chloroflexota bacterium]